MTGMFFSALGALPRCTNHLVALGNKT
jgi:hypothetical protein